MTIVIVNRGLEIICFMRETLHLKLLKNCRIAGISTIQYNFIFYFKDGVQCPCGQQVFGGDGDRDLIECNFCL